MDLTKEINEKISKLHYIKQLNVLNYINHLLYEEYLIEKNLDLCFDCIDDEDAMYKHNIDPSF